MESVELSTLKEVKEEINLNDPQGSFDISIPHFQGSGVNVIYTVSVQLEDETWQVKRKFADFSAFNDNIDIPEEFEDSVNFPTSTISFLFQSAETRRTQLEGYVKAISKIPSISLSWEFSYLVGGFKGKWLGLRNKRKTNGKILFPLPDRDFDPTEAAIPWKIFTMEGFEVIFATENAQKAAADDSLVHPTGIIWAARMGASEEALNAYAEMFESEAFSNPIQWSDIDPTSYDVIHLTGGHGPGMKQYLEAQVLKDKLCEFSKLGRTVSSICHGSLLLARSIDQQTGQSVVHLKK